MLFRSQISEKIKFGPLSSCRFREKRTLGFYTTFLCTPRLWLQTNGIYYKLTINANAGMSRISYFKSGSRSWA